MKNLTYLFHSRFGKYLKLILIFCAAFLTGRLLAKITSSEIISPDITALSVSSDPSGNWGLSFQEKGKQPLGNASIQELKQYNAFYVQDTDSKNIYLTFDAGYENGNTSAILDALKKHQVPATFFVVGNFLSQNPDLIKRMEKEGHIIGNHTMTHPNMSKISTKKPFRRNYPMWKLYIKKLPAKK